MSDIVKNLFDTDVYKYTMLQFIWLHQRKRKGRFAFKNRTDVDLLKYMTADQLRDEFAKIKEMSITDDMIEKLRNHPGLGDKFQPEFLTWLKTFKLADIHVRVLKNGKLSIYTHGKWTNISLWETFIMNVVNRLYFKAKCTELDLTEEEVLASGRNKLIENIEMIMTSPDIVITEFGTRRRWSYEWQREVILTWLAKAPNQIAGTSNVWLAIELGIKAIGTMAHEMDMGYQGIYHKEDDEHGYMYSHDLLMDQWFELYGVALAIALSDTYGSDYFLEHFKELAKKWAGTRHDSGDPFEYGEKVIKFYEDLGIDPKTKITIFSDGLDANLIVALNNRFRGRIKLGFGWGTNLSNNMGFQNYTNNRGLKALSIVCKLVLMCGRTTVKLSDNRAKVTGRKSAVMRVKRLSNYERHAHVTVTCQV